MIKIKQNVFKNIVHLFNLIQISNNFKHFEIHLQTSTNRNGRARLSEGQVQSTVFSVSAVILVLQRHQIPL